MRFLVLKLLCGLLILTCPAAFSESRGEALDEARALIQKNQTRLEQIDSSITSALKAIRNLGLAQNPQTRAKLSGLEKELENLSLQRREHLLRQEFLDRLSFQIDRHFRGGDLKSFLERKTLELAQAELSSREGHDQNLWKFLSYLSLAIKELPERHEAPFAFIEGYMSFSTLLNPIRPDEYSVLRNYTNGHEFATAAPVDTERLGEVVEAHLKEVEAASENELPFEQRKPFLKPLSQSFEETQKPSSLATEVVAPMPGPFEPPQILQTVPQEEAPKTEAAAPAPEEMKVRLIPKESTTQ